MLDTDNPKVMTVIVAGFLFILISIWLISSYFEASTFNALTGRNVSTWQAMWVRLRVQDEPSSYE